MHMHLRALNFSTLAMKVFNSAAKLFLAIIISTTLLTNFLLNALPPV